MRICLSAILYAAIVLTANIAVTANPASADIATLEALRTGDMKKLVFSEVKPLPAAVLLDQADVEKTLDDYKGKVVLLNFWATWCAPCREEMPTLARLQTAFADKAFAVVPIATGRNSVDAITKFFAQANVTNLPILRDPKQQLARDMGILGLPMTVILNTDGQEIARLIGDAVWDGPDAKAIIAALLVEN